MLARAYSLLEIKSVDAATRTIRGIATTPTPDRVGDVIEPLGATYQKEIPLLLHHRRDAPVGIARLGKATPDGIPFDADIAQIDEPGPVKDESDRAWQSVVHRLIRAVSIGFRPVGDWNDAVDVMKGGGLRFLKTEILELSLVTVPANQEATLAIVRSLDVAALGPTPPRVGGPPAGRTAMTIQEQITHWSNARAPKASRMVDLMNAAQAKGETLDDAATQEYDTLNGEVRSIDDHLARLRELDTLNIAAAAPVVPAIPKPSHLTSSAKPPVIQVKANVAPGTPFVRFCKALAATKGNLQLAENYARQWDDSTPEVSLVLRAAVAAGTTTDATWAGPLAPLRPLANEFLPFLRAATLLGRIPGLRNVPFNVSVPIQTGGGTYKWVGQGAPKPVGSLAFATITLAISKAAGIIVITDELARNSSPSAEEVIRNDMIRGIAEFLDGQFTNPAVAAVAGVSPASITNGQTPITSAGTSPANARTDLVALITAMTTAKITIAGASILMSEANASALGLALNSLGQPLFPTLTPTGGTALGINVVTSQSCGNNVILVQPDNVLYADDGGVTIDVSTEASLQMDSAPMTPPDATVVMTSLWQNNYIGLRAERFINWKVARAAAVQYTVQAYVG